MKKLRYKILCWIEKKSYRIFEWAERNADEIALELYFESGEYALECPLEDDYHDNPFDNVEMLKMDLEAAIAGDHFELAARLRDRIIQITAEKSPQTH